LNDPALVPIAEKYGKSVAQILIRYTLQQVVPTLNSDCLQQGWITLPKSVTKERIISNAEVFDWEISDEDMKRLNSLECYGVTGMRFLDSSNLCRLGSNYFKVILRVTKTTLDDIQWDNKRYYTLSDIHVFLELTDILWD